MSTPSLNNLTVASARELLGSFSCQEGTVESASEKALIRQALLLLASYWDYLNLGICAETPAQGLSALASYLKALGNEVIINSADLTACAGSVYIKFNGQNQKYYIDSYTGNYRGVLVSCQSSRDESINGTYGYLPLDLFVM
jgi:hypothetical protein